MRVLSMGIVLWLMLLLIGLAGCVLDDQKRCNSCGIFFSYSELRCNEYGMQFCIPCTKEYPNLFKNILEAYND